MQWPRGGGRAGADTLARYNYRVVLPAAGRQYNLSDLELSALISTGSGCCDCPANERRRYLLNGQLVVADGAREDQPQVLRR